MSGEKSTSFWATLPGIITAIATLITAIGGIWLIYDQVTDGSEPVIDNQGIIGRNVPEIDNQGTTSGDELNDQVTSAAKPPTIEYFDARPDKIVSGQDSILSWSVSDATDVTITPEIGDVPLTGSETVSPDITTTYTITAINEARSVKSNVDVVVDKNSGGVVDKSILSTPEQISPVNGTVISFWETKPYGMITLKWTTVPDATIYGIETEYYEGSWGKQETAYVTANSYTYDCIYGYGVYRWRVWAVDSMGKTGEKSDWWRFSYVENI